MEKRSHIWLLSFLFVFLPFLTLNAQKTVEIGKNQEKKTRVLVSPEKKMSLKGDITATAVGDKVKMSSAPMNLSTRNTEAISAGYTVPDGFYKANELYEPAEPALIYPLDYNLNFTSTSITEGGTIEWDYFDAYGNNVTSSEESIDVKYKTAGQYLPPLLTVTNGDQSVEYEYPVTTINVGDADMLMNFPSQVWSLWAGLYDPADPDNERTICGMWGYHPKYQFSRFIELYDKPLRNGIVFQVYVFLLAGSPWNPNIQATVNVRSLVGNNFDLDNDPILSSVSAAVGSINGQGTLFIPFSADQYALVSSENEFYLEIIGLPQDGSLNFQLVSSYPEETSPISTHYFFTIPQDRIDWLNANEPGFVPEGTTPNTVLNWGYRDGQAMTIFPVFSYAYIMTDPEGDVTVNAEGQTIPINGETSMSFENIYTDEDGWLGLADYMWDQATFTFSFNVIADPLPAGVSGRRQDVTLEDFSGYKQVITFIQGDDPGGIQNGKAESTIKVISEDSHFTLIYGNEATFVEVYTTSGQKVAQSALPAIGTHRLPYGRLNSGVYILKFSGPNGYQSTKAIKR